MRPRYRTYRPELLTMLMISVLGFFGQRMFKEFDALRSEVRSVSADMIDLNARFDTIYGSGRNRYKSRWLPRPAAYYEYSAPHLILYPEP